MAEKSKVEMIEHTAEATPSVTPEVPAEITQESVAAAAPVTETVAPVAPVDGSPDPQVAVSQEFKAPETNSPKGLSEFEVTMLWNDDMRNMKKHLESQEKVWFSVPLGFGEDARTAPPATVIMNGYQLNIKKGEFVQLPIDVARILADSHKLTLAAGQEHLIDRVKDGVNVADKLS